MRKKMSVSHDYFIQPFRHGVKILRPSDSLVSTASSLHALSEIGLSLYLTSLDQSIRWSNNFCLLLSGFNSLSQAIGKSIFDIPGITDETTYSVIQNNNTVIKTHHKIIVEETVMNDHSDILNFLTYKAPCYNEKNHLIGVFGCSFEISSHSLANSLKLISHLNFLNLNFNLFLKNYQDDIYLSKREAEILYFIIKGKTALSIAIALNLSKRTIEHYLENIKFKLKAKSREELIEKGFHYFGIGI